MALVKKSFVKFRMHGNSISCKSETSQIQSEESKKISEKYIREYKIQRNNLRFFYIKFKLLQTISMKNIKAAFHRRVKKIIYISSALKFGVFVLK